MATTSIQLSPSLIDKLSASMNDIIAKADEVAKKIENIGSKVENSTGKVKKGATIDFGELAKNADDLAKKFDALNEPGAKFNSYLKELEASTNLSGAEISKLGDKVRETSMDFGGDPLEMIQNYKSLVSRLGPDIAKDQDAFNQMGRNVATLSKTMNNDAVGAMDALTTSMLQMGVDMSNPAEAAQEMTRMMNVMAAGAKYGGASIPSISDAFKVAGVEIRNAKLSFEEGNSALQVLARGGKSGAEAGAALRDVLSKMGDIDLIPKDAQQRLNELGVNYDIVSNKSLPFTTRLKELQKVQADGSLMTQMFGESSGNVANILASSVDAQTQMTNSITGTNTATEQANIIMTGYFEKMNKAKSWFADFKVEMFGMTSTIAPFVSGFSEAISVITSLCEVIEVFNLVFMSIPLVGWIALIITGLIALGAYFYKTSATFRGILMGVWNFIKAFFTGIAGFVGEVFKGIWMLIKGVFNPLNWFDKNYKFSDGFSHIVNAAKTFGKNVQKAYTEGKKEGEDSFNEENSDTKATAKADGTGGKVVNNAGHSSKNSPKEKPQSAKIAVSDLSNGGGHSPGQMNGSGASAIRNITQKIDIKNYFTISGNADKVEVEAIAEKVVRAINSKLGDSIIATS